MTTAGTVARFESEPCGRCGGSGRYSWNAMHGDRCYGCGGKGHTLTKAGVAAKERWLEIARPQVLAADVKPGDVLYVTGFSQAGPCTVKESGPDTLNEGRWMITFEPGGVIGGHGALPTTAFRFAKTAESHRAAWDAVRGGPGVTVTVKEQTS